ncbi:MAG: hypothetical protein AAF492_01365, partial [Verrucomicrobiota bacterium]
GRTISQAIAVAGGYTDYANKKKIQLIRDNKVKTINMELVEKDPKQDFILESEDIIRIRRSVW